MHRTGSIYKSQSVYNTQSRVLMSFFNLLLDFFLINCIPLLSKNQHTLIPFPLNRSILTTIFFTSFT